MKHGTMTVKELKAVLNDLPDDMPIVIAGGYDHSYDTIGGVVEDDVDYSHGHYYETGGDPGNVKALIVYR